MTIKKFVTLLPLKNVEECSLKIVQQQADKKDT